MKRFPNCEDYEAYKCQTQNRGHWLKHRYSTNAFKESTHLIKFNHQIKQVLIAGLLFVLVTYNLSDELRGLGLPADWQ